MAERPDPAAREYAFFPVKVVRTERPDKSLPPALPFQAFSPWRVEYLGVCLLALARLASLVLFRPAYGLGLAILAPQLGRLDLFSENFRPAA